MSKRQNDEQDEEIVVHKATRVAECMDDALDIQRLSVREEKVVYAREEDASPRKRARRPTALPAKPRPQTQKPAAKVDASLQQTMRALLSAKEAAQVIGTRSSSTLAISLTVRQEGSQDCYDSCRVWRSSDHL